MSDPAFLGSLVAVVVFVAAIPLLVALRSRVHATVDRILSRGPMSGHHLPPFDPYVERECDGAHLGHCEKCEP